MGLFDESKNYGFVWVRQFNQKTDPFIEYHKEKFPTLDSGACAGFGINWLEFKQRNPGAIYENDDLQNEETAEKIIETQLYVRYKDKSLETVLSNIFCLKKQDTNNLFEPGIKTISFKSKSQGNHVAVAYCYELGDQLIFELFEPLRGDITCDLNSETSHLSKEWISKYLNSYEERGFQVEISCFPSKWPAEKLANKLYNDMKEVNRFHEDACDAGRLPLQLSPMQERQHVFFKFPRAEKEIAHETNKILPKKHGLKS